MILIHCTAFLLSFAARNVRLHNFFFTCSNRPNLGPGVLNLFTAQIRLSERAKTLTFNEFSSCNPNYHFRQFISVKQHGVCFCFGFSA